MAASYRALLILHAIKLPWQFTIRQHAEAALAKARECLASHSSQWTAGEYLWIVESRIEKVTYKLLVVPSTGRDLLLT